MGSEKSGFLYQMARQHTIQTLYHFKVYVYNKQSYRIIGVKGLTLTSLYVSMYVAKD